MRKMKKINGYLVVRFNDRERQTYPALGKFGIIDAEAYTGNLHFDREVMECMDAETIEIAVEQARGLNAEEDFSEEPTTYTVIAETADEAREEEVAPKALALSYEERLKAQVKGRHYPNIDPRTAAHELYGYKAALVELGLLDADEAIVEPDVFGEACQFYTSEGHRAEIPLPLSTGPAVLNPHDYEEGETFTGCTVQALMLQEIEEYVTGESEPESPVLEAFKNLSGIENGRDAGAVYKLGLALAEECPDNDCQIYLNTFNMARELDTALDIVIGAYPASVLYLALAKLFGELWDMYRKNYAVQQYKEGMRS